MTEVIKLVRSETDGSKKQIFPQSHVKAIIGLQDEIDNKTNIVKSVNGQTGDVDIDLENGEVINARTDSSGKTYNTLKDRIDNTDKSINSRLSEITTTPETFSNLNDLQAQYPNGKSGIFVTANDGHKYIWSHNQWTDAGIYQGVGIGDIQKLDIYSFVKNEENILINGEFINLENIISQNSVKLSSIKLMGSYGVNIKSKSSNVNDLGPWQGAVFPLKEDIKNSWNNDNFPLINYKLGIISSSDVALVLSVSFRDQWGTELDGYRIKTLYLKAGELTNLNSEYFKYKTKVQFDNICISIADESVDVLDFSIFDLNINMKGLTS